MKIKKSLVAISCAVLLMMPAFFSCNETKESIPHYNDLFFDNLTGEIKKTEETSYRIDSAGKIGIADSCCTSITEYDDKGYRSRQFTKDINGNEKNGQTYISRYNDGKPKEIHFTQNGKTISTLSGSLDTMGKYGDTRIYDAAGKLEFYYSGITLNEYGKIILMKKFTPDSILQETIINNYTKQIWVGGLIKDNNGKEIFLTTIQLNEKMDPVLVTEIVMTDSLPDITTTRYTYNLYDRTGNWIERNETDEKGTTLKTLKRKITYKNK